jgi:thiol-disulfide isomerase/thioredoxin
VLAALAALWLLPSCSTAPAATTSPAAATPAVNATTAPLLPVTVDALPKADLDSFQALLSQLRGTPVVINYWASWCVPCREEMPLLVAAHQRLGAHVQFLGVNVQDARASAVRFLGVYGVAFPSLFDPAGELGAALGLLGPPATSFFAADGSLVATVRGQISARDLDRYLARLTE